MNTSSRLAFARIFWDCIVLFSWLNVFEVVCPDLNSCGPFIVLLRRLVLRARSS